MRLLLVTHYYPQQGSGVEIVAGELAKRLSALGVDVRWAASAPSDQLAAIQGVSLLPMAAWNPLERTFGIPYPLWSPFSLARLNREVSRCDAVHLHDTLYFGNLTAALLARKRRRPVLVTQHIGLIPYRNPVFRWLMRAATATLTYRVLAHCDQAVFISRNVMSFFGRLKYRRAPLFIPNGVDHHLFQPATEERRAAVLKSLGLDLHRPVVLFVGRFVETKGLPLVRALAQRFSEYSWVLVGRGPIDPTTWKLPQVRCVGPVGHEQTLAFYQAADLLILPSLSEGFPLVVQEAMACGTPALITPETACAIPGVEGVTFRAEPNLDDMTRALGHALESRERLRQTAAAAAAFAWRHFDWDKCAEQYLELVLSLMRGKNDRSVASVPIS